MTDSRIFKGWLAARLTYGLVAFATDIGVLTLTRWRDVALAAGARTLARLTEVRKPVPVRIRSDANARRLHAEA